MPGDVLTPREPVAGFFGKLPCTGDFVARGLPPAFRPRWDGWVTQHLAPYQGGWPDGGLRFRLGSGGRVAAGVIVPSRDSAGRRFPLSLVLTGDALPGPEQLERWCDAAAAATRDTPEALLLALDALPCPTGAPPADAAPFLLWRRGQTAEACDPRSPAAVLARLLPPGATG